VKVLVKLGGIKALEQKALAAIAALPKTMLAAASSGAAYERGTHAYRNRTGNLERSTQAKTLRVSGSEIRVQLAMMMPYAGYVRARGLSNIDEAAEKTTDMIVSSFAKLAG